MKTAPTFLFILFLAATLAAQTPINEEAAWQDFFAWVKKTDIRSASAQAYRAKLVKDGLTEAQADERMALVKKLSEQHKLELVALNFDKIYTAPIELFNVKPNAFLQAMVKDVKPGAALDVAMGQGRNAVYLAQQGWQVTGFDIADEGLKLAQASAANAGVKITTVKSAYEDFDFGKEKWDLIVFAYAWVPVATPELVERMRTALKPGGLVVIEHPAEDPLKPADKREWAPTAADEVNTLAKVWTSGFRLLRYEDTQDRCDWRNRIARVLRLMAQKW